MESGRPNIPAIATNNFRQSNISIAAAIKSHNDEKISSFTSRK